ncbi:MAG: hypothetical protein A3H28_07685 [Acidobacteria bacterium RIFCSPLOWO2_02_FULL_61_28]|nr:MAG: hypothetical protein A3H28_07685 [Acidobacteria bacterium RIFCSPLOWO2_02_FULL_61_28]
MAPFLLLVKPAVPPDVPPDVPDVPKDAEVCEDGSTLPWFALRFQRGERLDVFRGDRLDVIEQSVACIRAVQLSLRAALRFTLLFVFSRHFFLAFLKRSSPPSGHGSLLESCRGQKEICPQRKF